MLASFLKWNCQLATNGAKCINVQGPLVEFIAFVLMHRSVLRTGKSIKSKLLEKLSLTVTLVVNINQNFYPLLGFVLFLCLQKKPNDIHKFHSRFYSRWLPYDEGNKKPKISIILLK